MCQTTSKFLTLLLVVSQKKHCYSWQYRRHSHCQVGLGMAVDFSMLKIHSQTWNP
jgi:hypothetical protein